MPMRPLGALFDPELSDLEAQDLYLARKVLNGGEDPIIFMAIREVVIHLQTQNGLVADMQRSLNNHLDKHPANENVQQHLDEGRDSNVRIKFIQKMGGLGNALVVFLVCLFGGFLTLFQLIEFVK